MNSRNYLKTLLTVAISAAMVLPSAAQEHKEKGKEKKEKAGEGKPNESEMMAQMMELAKPGENHKLLDRSVGNWSYKVRMWMDPEASGAPMESSGSAIIKSIMDGRYLISEHFGKMQMPGPDGKMMDMEFKGMSMEGYDNVKKKFVASWIDNMGTGIMNLEGTYDAASKTFTYVADYEPMPGMKTKVREVIKIKDNDHHIFEWYEDRGGKEVRTMEIAYTRKS
jgi:hypothetical protein